MSVRFWPLISCWLFSCFLISGVEYPGNPPPAHTGGFGEPTCYDCHFDGELNVDDGSLILRGLEQGYAIGALYDLEVVLSRQDMARAGFQLSSRFAEGAQAGKQAGKFLISGEDLTIDRERDISYVCQTETGAELVVSDTIVWHLRWKSPQSNVPVVFHAAANAANGDDSEFGDAIYLTSIELMAKQ